MATDSTLEVIQRVADPSDLNTLRRFCDQVRDTLNSLIRSGQFTSGSTPGTGSIVINLASPSGLEYSASKLRIDLDSGGILELDTGGLQFATEKKNTGLRGPASGADASPTFRADVAADLGTGTADTTTFLRGDLAWTAAGMGSTNFITNEVPSGTVNGSNDTFTLANTPVAGTVQLYNNGLRQTLTTDYTISSATITFTAGNIPLTGDVLIADYHK